MIPILRCRDVRGQLRALEEMETPIPAPNSSGRPPDCYLTRLPPSAKGQQDLLTLGPYSRWLIALSLLLPSNGNGALQGDLRSHPVDCVFAVRGPRNKRMMTAHRYNHLVPQENPLDDVLELILTKLNDLFGPIRGKITRAEFLTVWVPISPLSGKTEPAPIEWFTNWLRWGVGTPLPSDLFDLKQPAESTSSQTGSKVLPTKALRLIAAATEGVTQCRLVNIYTENPARSIAGYESELRPYLGSASGRSPIPIIRISLARGVSRHSALKELYAKLSLDPRTLGDIERRAVDLHWDLEPVRHALTVNRLVLAFEELDNFTGPFAALHDYLCNAHWLEFIRAVAQPHLKIWHAAAGSLQLRYAILVFSTRPAQELVPWASIYLCLPTDREDATEGSVQSVAKPCRKESWDGMVANAALRLIAASVNGLRADTLHRCLHQWARLFECNIAPEKSDDRDARICGVINELTSYHAELLKSIPDAEGDILTPSQRAAELSRGRPRSAQKTSLEESCKLWTFANTVIRGQFIDSWVKDKSHDNLTWAHINFVLADEALNQVTAQLRHTNDERIMGTYSMRRIIQAVYHGLMSLELDEPHFSSDAVHSGGLFGLLLPALRLKRYRFLFCSLYRHMAESQDWRFTRAFGRADLSVDLLTLFVRPDTGPLMLTDMHGDSVAPLPVDDPEQIAQALREDSHLCCEVLEILGRVACDLGGTRGDPIVKWVLRVLSGTGDVGALRALRPAPGDYHDHVVAAALRLRIDWRLTSGHPQSVIRLCRNALVSLSIDPASIEGVKSHVSKLLSLLETGAEAEPEIGKNGIRAELSAALDSVLLPIKEKTNAAALREAASATILRFAEALSEIAGVGHDEAAISDLAYACILFWVGDRLRSESAILRESEAQWPRASARATRAYIRVCFKLARLLSEVQVDGDTTSLHRLIERLMKHGQTRQGVHARHNLQYRRERVSMLILEAGRLRTWVRISLRRARPKNLADSANYRATIDTPEAPATGRSRRVKRIVTVSPWKAALDENGKRLVEQGELLKTAWDLLQEAEGHLLSLGYQSAHARRLWIERVKIALSFAELAHDGASIWYVHDSIPTRAQVLAHLNMASHWLELLTESSKGSLYWSQLASRLNLTMSKVRERLPETSLSMSY